MKDLSKLLPSEAEASSSMLIISFFSGNLQHEINSLSQSPTLTLEK
jgi:hypothetical protein